MKSIAFWIVSLSFAATALAQLEPVKPGPEHKKLDMGSGAWIWNETCVESPFGPAGKSTYSSESKMILGGLFLEERGRGNTPSGPALWLGLSTYDTEKKTYVGINFDNSLSSKPWKGEHSTGTVDGNIWTWTWKSEVKGKTYQSKSVLTFSPDLKTASYEWFYAEEGSSWKSQLKGQGTKIGEVH